MEAEHCANDSNHTSSPLLVMIMSERACWKERCFLHKSHGLTLCGKRIFIPAINHSLLHTVGLQECEVSLFVPAPQTICTMEPHKSQNGHVAVIVIVLGEMITCPGAMFPLCSFDCFCFASSTGEPSMETARIPPHPKGRK